VRSDLADHTPQTSRVDEYKDIDVCKATLYARPFCLEQVNKCHGESDEESVISADSASDQVNR
jgi:hypothetical protein